MQSRYHGCRELRRGAFVPQYDPRPRSRGAMRDISHLRHGVTWLTLNEAKSQMCTAFMRYFHLFSFYFTSRQSTVLNGTQPYFGTRPRTFCWERTPAPPEPRAPSTRASRPDSTFARVISRTIVNPRCEGGEPFDRVWRPTAHRLRHLASSRLRISRARCTVTLTARSSSVASRLCCRIADGSRQCRVCCRRCGGVARTATRPQYWL